MSQPRRTEPVISVREIEMQARGRVEAIGRDCLPGAIKDGQYLKAGSIGGERGGSLVLNLAGANKGMWKDWSGTDQGDMIGLVERTKFGGDRGKAVQWLKSFLGLDHLDPGRIAQVRAEAAQADADMQAEAEKEAEAKKRGARSLWLNGTPSIEDTPAARYLDARGIRMGVLGHWPRSLRFHSEVWNRDAGVKLPAMVSQVILPTGEHVATHRTWLGRCPTTRTWVKADGADLGVPRGNAKKMLGKSRGGFIPLRKGASQQAMGRMRRPETLYVTEGIEDGLTVAMCKPDARVIAAYSLGNLGAIEFPPEIETIVLVADRDDGAQEQEKLERAIARQQARGHRVQLVLPPPGLKDVNAWLLAGLENAA
jgi:hypothetical protein